MNPVVEVAPVSDLHERQSEIMAQLAKGPVILTEHGRGAAVLLSMQEWQEINEQLLSVSESNALRALYAEFDEEERALAETGLGYYARVLKEEEDNA